MGSRRHWTSIATAGLLLAIYLATASSSPSVDAASASVQGWRIATAAEPWLEDVDLEGLPYSYETPPLGIATTDAGHDVVHASPGVTMAAVPAYIGASSDPSDFRILPASLFAAFVAWLAVLILHSALSRTVGARQSTIVCAVLALGTPVWSVAADAMWTHTLTILGIAGAAWAASRDRWLLAGALAGLGVLGRLHFSLIPAVLGVVVGTHRRQWGATLRVAAGSLPFLLIAASWSRWLYGNWDPAGGYAQVDAYASRTADWTLPEALVNLLGFLLSPGKGILVWTPVILFLIPALWRSWRSQPDWTRALAAGGCLYSLAQGLMSYFAGGSAFYGYRLSLELLLCLTPALAVALTYAGRVARSVLPFVAGLQVAAIALGAIFNSPGLPLEEVWTNNAFADLLVAAPILVAPWLLCGVLGVVMARALSGAQPLSNPANDADGTARAPAR